MPSGLETVDSHLGITHNRHPKSPTGNPTALTRSLTGVGEAQPSRTLQGGKPFHLQRRGATAGRDSSARPPARPEARSAARPGRARAQARGGRRGSPRPAQLRWLDPGARPVALPQRPGGTAGSRSPKLGRQRRAGRRGSRNQKAAGTRGSRPASYLTGPRLAGSALGNAWRKRRAAQPLKRVCAGRKEGQGMGTGRDAEHRVPGARGPATFRALRPAARVRQARAPTRRDVTAAGRPARALVWVSPCAAYASA